MKSFKEFQEAYGDKHQGHDVDNGPKKSEKKIGGGVREQKNKNHTRGLEQQNGEKEERRTLFYGMAERVLRAAVDGRAKVERRENSTREEGDDVFDVEQRGFESGWTFVDGRRVREDAEHGGEDEREFGRR